MKTSTFDRIKTRVGEVESSLKTFDTKAQEGNHFGREGEYTSESLKSDLKTILGDIRALTKAHDEFVRLSSWEERDTIAGHLADIESNLKISNYMGVVNILDALKVSIRSYNFRTSTESEEVLKERIEHLDTESGKLEETAEEIEKIGVKAQAAQEHIQSAVEQHAAFSELFNNLKDKSSQIDTLHHQDQQRSQEINKLLTSAKSKEDAMNIFSDHIGERESKLTEQEQKTREYEEHLFKYQKQHEKILKQVQELTASAEEALRNAATVGLSGALHERYEDEKEKGWLNLLWLLGGAGFAVVAMALGYFMLSNQEDITLGAVVARIAIMSVAISGAWFCASQYVRYRNTLDDYGYKSVLARSIVAFLDQFNDPDERADYLKTVLGEIHQDPLRKKHDADTPVRNFLQGFRKNKDTENEQ